MSRVVLLIALLSLVLAAGAGWSGELLTMPLVEGPASGDISGTYYYVRLSPPEGGSDRLEVLASQVGLSPEMEAGLTRVTGPASYTVLNVAYRLQLKEAPEWQGALGVVNLIGDDYFYRDEASPYVIVARELKLGEEPPTLKKPVITPFVGYGSNSHRGWFGGVRFDVAEPTSLTAAYYAHHSIFALRHKVPYRGGRWIFGIGTRQGDPWFSFTIPGWYWY